MIASNRVQVNLRSEPTLKKMLNSPPAAGTASARWTIDYVAQRNDNSIDEPNDNWEFRSGACDVRSRYVHDSGRRHGGYHVERA